MSTQDAREPRLEEAPPSRLSELLECERELAMLMTAAHDEARRRISEARAEAARAEAELEASVEGESERVRVEIRGRSQARVRQISARARERVARCEGVSEAELARVAGAAFRRLLGGEESA